VNKYLRAVSTNFAYLAVNAGFFLIVTPLAIKVMGEEFYGLWAMLSALMLFSNVGALGMDAIVMKFSSEASADGDPQTQSNKIITAGTFVLLAMSILTAALLLLARNLISGNINAGAALREDFRQAVVWIAASIVPQFLSRVPYGYLLSQFHNGRVRQIELFSSVSLWLGTIVIALVGKNLVAVAAWCLFSNALVYAMYFWSVQRLVHFRLQPDLPTLRKLLHFSGYMFIENLAITLFQQFDKIVVGFTLGPALAGVYSVGTSLALRLSIVTGQATEVMIPYASLQESLGDQKKLFAVFRQLSQYIGLMLAGAASLLVIWMNEILSVWISPDYAARYAGAFRILIVAYGLLSLSRPAHQTLTGMGRVRFTAFFYMLATILMLAGVFFLSREFGFLGAAASNLALALLLVFDWSVYRRFQDRSAWKPMLADLQWGLSLPVLAYGVSLFLSGSFLMIKFAETVILGIFFVWVIATGPFSLLKTRLSQIKRVVFKSTT
jgi:O-antigen/teichoic acid export membrane protein